MIDRKDEWNEEKGRNKSPLCELDLPSNSDLDMVAKFGSHPNTGHANRRTNAKCNNSGTSHLDSIARPSIATYSKSQTMVKYDYVTSIDV